MTDGDAIPAHPQLSRMATANIVLGIITAIRLVPEGAVIVPRDPGGVYYLLLALDVFWALLWIGCGLMLRTQARAAIRLASVGGALLLGISVSSAIFFGRDFLRYPPSPQASNYHQLLAFYGSRMLLYVIQIVFWAYALLVLLKQTPGRATFTAIVGALLAGVLLQTILVVSIFGW